MWGPVPSPSQATSAVVLAVSRGLWSQAVREGPPPAGPRPLWSTGHVGGEGRGGRGGAGGPGQPGPEGERPLDAHALAGQRGGASATRSCASEGTVVVSWGVLASMFMLFKNPSEGGDGAVTWKERTSILRRITARSPFHRGFPVNWNLLAVSAQRARPRRLHPRSLRGWWQTRPPCCPCSQIPLRNRRAEGSNARSLRRPEALLKLQSPVNRACLPSLLHKRVLSSASSWAPS